MKQAKQTFSVKSIYPFLKSILTLLLLAGTVAALHAQPNMNANGLFYRIEYDGDGYVDLTIPDATGQELFFVLNGGDGGRRVVPDLCKVKGGEGATVTAAFAVGTGPGRLNPGGVIRFIPGQRGESNTGGGINGGGGGGGTGILYKAPGANITCDVPSLSLADASSCWVLLGVAGGGGGAYSGGLCGGSAGKGGNDGTQGKDGSDNGVGEDRSGSGGTNGEGGSTGQGGTGGGGYLTNGLGNNDTNAGKAGKFEGGNGDNGLQNGGFGYGGGGSGNTGGGGGGGFSGGGGADEFAEGGGGGSFVNDAALYSEKQEGGTQNKPKSGYVEYQFRASSTNAPKAICKTTTIEVDENGTAVIDAAQLGEGSFDPNGDQLFFCIVLPGFGPLVGSCEETLTFDCQDFGDESTWIVVVSDGESASTCRATIVVEDNDAPVITCRPTLEITLDEAVDATVTLTPNDLLTSSFDNCAITAFTLSQSTFSCSNSSDIGTHTVTLTAADNDDNFSSCTTEVTINRFTVACGSDFSATVPNGECDVWIDMPPFAGELGCGYFVDSQVCKVSEDLSTGGTEVDCSDYTTEDKSGVYGPGEYFIRWSVNTPTGGGVGLCRTDFTVEKEVPDPLDCVPDFSVTIPDGECEAWVGIPPPYNAITCGDYLESRVCVRDDLDNCPLPDGSDKSGNYPPGEYQVEWFLFQSDDAFVEGCTTYFTVEESEVPTAVCQDITVALDASGNVSITAADVDGGSTYSNCGISSLSATPTAFDCTTVGPNSVTLTAEDASGNGTSCTATVTVEDNIPPTLVCQDITLDLDENGTASNNPFLNGAFVSQSDNCSVVGGLSVTGPGIYTCSNIGTFPIIIIQDDPSGNETTCTYNVTVQDVTPPTAVCSGGATVYINATGIAPVDAAALDGGSTDNCTNTLTFSASPSTFGCGAVGSQPVTLTVIDGSGNTATCNTTVEVVDDEAPTAVCKNVTVQLGTSGNASITTADINNGSSDACGIASASLDQTSFDCANVGANTVALTVTDNNGNSSSCNATVTVEDQVDPQANCQGMTVQLNNNGMASITAADIDNNSSDACGIASTSLDQTSFDCANVGANTVALTVTDNNGNSSSCNATVTVEDQVDPQANCQGMTVQLNNNGIASITAADIDNNSSDVCGIASAALDQTSFDCADIGANTVALTVTDNNGNSSSCNATVTVEDQVAPQANCQGMTVQLNNNGTATITAADIDNNSSDACGIASASLDQTSFDCANVGANTVALTVTDNNGNSSSCNATVTVEDQVDPQANCQGMTVQLNNNGTATITAADIDNNSSDACGIASTSLDQTSFDCANVGANTVALTVTDNNGNSSSCNATVTVEDKVAPQANCQGMTVQLNNNGTATITAADIDNNSSDACGIASASLDKVSFDCADIGTNTVALTVTDNNGNSSSCNATVTVEDKVAPQANCQGMTVQLNNNGTATITAADIDNNSSDACGIASVSLDKVSFDCANVGANIVSLTVTDNYGNGSSCNATVTVEDNTAPDALCQDITVQLGPAGAGSTNGQAVDNGSTDACGIQSLVLSQTSFDCSEVGNNAETLTVTDVNGNVSTCSTTVTVEDNVAPDAICQDVTVQLDPTGLGNTNAQAVNNGSSDACPYLPAQGGQVPGGIQSLVLSQTDFDCSEVGNNTVTLTVTDVNGNASTCTANVTVVLSGALPPEWSANDIGDPGNGSDYDYDPCVGNNPDRGDFTISTGGYNLIPQDSDNLAFATVPLCGNGGIQARIESVSGGYAGLMIRESSAPGAKMVAVYSNLTNLLRRETRTVTNGSRSSSTVVAAFPKWLRLFRQGDYIRAFYRNSNGGDWTLFHQAYVPMGNCVEMGMAVFTTDPNGDATAVFGNLNYQSQGGQSLSAPNIPGWSAEMPEVVKASVVPNPVRGQFTLQFSKPLPTAGQATLLNEFGQRLLQQPLRAGETELGWDAGALPAGLYFLEVLTGDGYREVLKVVRQ